MDIDIDFKTDFDPLSLFKDWVRATVLKDGELTPHPCGIYLQKIAIDPMTGLAAIPYRQAEELGFYKLDFLHLSAYDIFESRDELLALASAEPNWDLLKLRTVVEDLFQLRKSFDVVDAVQPRSLLELSDVMALIRPGKRNLMDFYLKDREKGRRLIYAKTSEGYSFKKSHALSYAMVAKMQLCLLG